MTRKQQKSGRSGFQEGAAPFEAGEPALRAVVDLGRGGRVVIPAAMRAQMGISEGSKLVLLLKGEALAVFTPEAGVRRAQRLAKMWDRGEGSIVDELIEDRRREAEEEENS